MKQLLTIAMVLGAALLASGAGSATASSSAVDWADIAVSSRGYCPWSVNVPDCIAYAAYLATWASDTAGHLACDILCKGLLALSN